MMIRLSKLIKGKSTGKAVIGILNATIFGVLLLSPVPGLALTNPAANEACQGVNLVAGSGCGDNGLQVSNTLTTFINIFSAIIGLVAVIMVIIAGLQFITASGNPQNIAKARSSLIYAIVGLIIVVLAQVLVHFVITQAATAK